MSVGGAEEGEGVLDNLLNLAGAKGSTDVPFAFDLDVDPFVFDLVFAAGGAGLGLGGFVDDFCDCRRDGCKSGNSTVERYIAIFRAVVRFLASFSFLGLT